MKIVRGLMNVPKMPKGCVLTFGNFDSVHRGHQSIISRVVDVARQQKIPSCLMIFEPQPEEFFRPDICPARLTRLKEKLKIFQSWPIDYVIVLHFNQAMALLSAQQFLEEILLKRIHMRYLIVGEDCRFGANKQGNIDWLQQVSKQFKFTLEISQTLEIQPEGHPHFAQHHSRVSSTLVRQALAEGDLPLVTQLLGRVYSFSGRVVHGDKRGRSFGFPTANIYLHRKKSPLWGVYWVQVGGLDGQVFNGIANVGYRPTVKKNDDSFRRILLEVHLFDFNQTIYGQSLQIEFIKKIRNEQRFESFELLKKQIQIDIEQVRRLILTQ